MCTIRRIGFHRAHLTAAALLLLLVCGCASHEVVPTSGPRTATRAEDVKIYQKHPKKYERLGTVSVAVTPEVQFDERGDANVGFDRLKAKAAALGANGLLLALDGVEGSNMLATVGYHGTFYQVPLRTNPRTAMAQAIYVLDD
jgi:hypothetical protein